MAKVYYRQIMAGKMTIDDVPERWRDEVKVLFKKDEEQNNIIEEEI